LCDETTREGKPYCPKHVLGCVYAESVLNKRQAAEDEVRDVAKRGVEAVNLNGLIVEEILAAIENKKMTFRRLVKDHVVHLRDNKAAPHYLTALRRADLVEVELNTRKTEVVFLTDKGLRAVRGD